MAANGGRCGHSREEEGGGEGDGAGPPAGERQWLAGGAGSGGREEWSGPCGWEKLGRLGWGACVNRNGPIRFVPKEIRDFK